MVKIRCRNFRGEFIGIYLVFNNEDDAEQFNNKWFFGKFHLVCWHAFFNTIAICERWPQVPFKRSK